jgi:hypothetical protein
MEMKLESLKDLIGLFRLVGLSKAFKLIPTPHYVIMRCMGALMQLFNIISLFGLKQNLKYNKTM